jgi:spore coat polysaccharide biosynthesis protein SpsF (cytidylyltransferase family)
MAVAAGAEIVEVHATLDREEENPDHYSALEPEEFDKMVEKVRKAEKIVGEAYRDLPEDELQYRRGHKKWVVAQEKIEDGELLSEEKLCLKRVEDETRGGFRDIDRVIGKKTKHKIGKNKAVQMKDMYSKIAAVLACRAESTRLYGKPLNLVGDEPILKHLVEQIRKIDHVDEIVLAISDTPSKESFKKFAEEEGVEYVIGPEENVLKRIILGAEEVDADTVVRTTTENPFIYWENGDELIEEHIERNSDLTGTKNLPLGAFLEVISLDALRKSHKQGKDKHRSELVNSYIVENSESFDINSISPPSQLERPEIRLTVDHPSDLILARKLYEESIEKYGEVNLENIIEIYDSDEEFQKLNDHRPDGTHPDVENTIPHIYGEK